MTGRKIRYSDEVTNESFGIPHILIHWINMDLLGEFHCSCGAREPVQGSSVQSIKCNCGQEYELPADIELKKVENAIGPCWSPEGPP